ncbi:hypothetical protein EU527_03695 [Candidatus Thorarchaeota archaeon]|nr:MAG: hypothetical protein EU527_03695 [Candidatus Thorarchaeota archaeon]
MQNEIIDTIFNFLSDPLNLILALWIVGIIIAIAIFRRPKSSKGKKPEKEVKKPKIKVKGPLMKQIGKMMSDVDKGKELTVPSVRSRDEIITEMFESQMNAVGLKASTASGYVPVSYTPLARFLKERGVPEDTVGAIIAGILEEESEADVRAIIEATAESPEVNLVGAELDKAKQLAVDEWAHVKKAPEN